MFLMPREEYQIVMNRSIMENGKVDTGKIAKYFQVSTDEAAIRGKLLGYLKWQKSLGVNTMNKIKTAKFSAMDFAKFIINFCTVNEMAISELKLQRILYYIQLAFICHLQREAFTDDIEAGKYGPFIRTVHKKYSSYGSTKICLLYDKVNIFNELEEEIILSVLCQCIHKSSWELIDLCKVNGSPWKCVYEKGKRKIIPKKLLYNYALLK